MVKITEEKNDLHIIPPVMICDAPLSEDIPAPLPSKNHVLVINAPPGGGKTSSMVSLLTSKGKNKAYRKVFHNVYFVMPPNSRASLQNTIFEKHDPEKIYDELSPEVLLDIHEKLMNEASEGYNSLVILDDVGSYLKSKENETLLRNMVFNHRHLRSSFWILQQNFTSLPLSIRKCITHCMMFKGCMKNKKEYQSIFDELIDMDKKLADQVVQYVFKSKNKHDFMFIDKNEREMYRNFNKLILNSD
jgi:hypothetical protein